MEIYKLKYRNSVWLNFDKNIEFEIKRLKSGKISIRYYKLGENDLKLSICGADANALDNKLKLLDFDKWENEYEPPYPVLDGEEWDIEIEFVDGKKKLIHGSNGYPKCWNKFLTMIKWSIGLEDKK